MAQTHENINHSPFLDELRDRAAKAQKQGASTIAAGSDTEKPIHRWKGSNGVHCQQIPDDPQGILRLSIGGGDNLPITLNYLTYRGKTGECIALLEKALAALRECPE